MRPAPRRLLEMAALLKIGLGPAVAPAQPMVRHRMLVEMLGREPRIALPVKPLDLLGLLLRNPLRRGLAQPAVQQAGFTVLLVAPAPAPQRAFVDSQQLRSLQLAQAAILTAPENVPELHHPHTLQNLRPLHLALPLESHHEPDRSCAT